MCDLIPVGAEGAEARGGTIMSKTKIGGRGRC